MFVRPRVPKSAEPVRIQIGGPSRGEGWIRVSLCPDDDPDLWLSPSDLHVYPNATVVAIAVDRGFERFRPDEARRVIQEWRRILSDEGELSIDFPDLEGCLAILGRSRNGEGIDPAVEAIFAGGARWGWTRASLQEELEHARFGWITFDSPHDPSRPRCLRAKAHKVSSPRVSEAPRSTAPSSALDLLS